jgi:hypothetical protein
MQNTPLESLYRNVKLLPIYLLFLTTWAMAGAGKLMSGGVPDFFTEKFSATFLASFPGLTTSFYSIAIAEVLAAILFLIALVNREFLPGVAKTWTKLALWLSLLIWVQLGFGMRLTMDFGGAASLFFYFGATLIALFYVEWDERQSTSHA